MTPKEKAEELIKKFQHAKQYSNSNNAMSFELAKQCALIAVNEMEEVWASALVALGHSKEEAELASSPYLQQVKKEIEKL